MDDNEMGKKSNKKHRTGINHIDFLPDSIHIEILALLPTVDAYRASFVSTRWRRLWKSIHILDFRTKLIKPKPGFVPFIDRLLSLHDASPVTSLRFGGEFYEPAVAPSVDSWVHFAAGHAVQDLDLSFLPPSKNQVVLRVYKLPRRLFDCRCLRKLVLVACDLNLGGPVDFPYLSYLELIRVRLDSTMINALIAGSPLLTYLCIRRCVVDGLLRVEDSKGHVSFLNIVPVKQHNSKIEIVVSKLKVLIIGDVMPQAGVRVVGCKDLGSAVLDFQKMLECSFVLEDWNWYSNLVKIISDISHAKMLKLCSWCIQVFTIWGRESLGGVALRRPRYLAFDSLTGKLEIPGILYLFKRFSPVTSLSITFPDKEAYIKQTKIKIATPGFDENEYLRPEGLPLFVLQHLLVVVIYGLLKEEDMARQKAHQIKVDEFLERRKNEIELVKFFLINSKELRKMNFNRRPSSLTHLYREHKEDSEFMSALFQQLQSLPRTSPEAELDFF